MTPPRISVWPPLSLLVYARARQEALPFPLDTPGHTLFARARHALWHGVHAIGLQPGDEVLVPAYHHGSEVEALLRAGLVCCFYDGTPMLEPDEGELDALRSPRTRALYLTHFLGFPQDSARWRSWCDERALLLIEDAAQAWLATRERFPVGTWGDLSIFCVYKTVGVPDGGAVVGRPGPPAPARAAAFQPKGVLRRHATWAFAHSRLLSTAVRESAASRPYDPEEDFALGDPAQPASRTTAFLLPRLADDAVAARRRAHYELLLERLRPLVPDAFAQLPPGASPFAFPVAANDKEGLLGRLADGGVSALNLWSIPHPSLPAERFPQAAALRRTVVALPVHQELRCHDLGRIVARVGAPRKPAVTLEELKELDALRDEWSELAATTGNVFATWEWNTVWWRHFGRGRRLLAATCRDPAGELVAILPLYVARERPLRVVRFLGHGTADELAPISSRARRAAAAEALRRLLARHGSDVFVGDHMPAQSAWSALLGARALRRNASPVLRFRGQTWDELLAARSANFREQVRRRERRLRREHSLSFRLAEDPGQLPRDLDHLFALHGARWADRSSSFGGSNETFHRDFAAAALERGWLRLWFLELDGRPVAAWYGFRYGDAEAYYQAGRDPTCDRLSVGFVLLAHTIRQALEDGMAEYRFLRGDEAFKYRFATEDDGLETIALAATARGAAAIAAGTVVTRSAWMTGVAKPLGR